MDERELASEIEDARAAGIAAAISRLIASGTLQPGDRLPTVRALASVLGVSPTTVSEAWSTLSGIGAIEAKGRAGTTVRASVDAAVSGRYGEVTGGSRQFALDLSTGTPDPALLPNLSSALTEVAGRSLTTNYLDDPVLPELDATLRADWPFAPEALTVVDGAMDALDRLISVLVPFGARVLVENPTFPPLLDRLELAGAEVLPLPIDADGIIPSGLDDALRHRPAVLFLQPRAHNPTGVSMSEDRAGDLAGLLRDASTFIVEDDHAGPIASTPARSLGSHLPRRTIRITSFSKSYGPDLRLAAIGGAAEPIGELVARRRLGAGWSSRLLQAALNELMHDRGTQAEITAARTEYAERRRRLVEGLATHGVEVGGSDGINVWIPVTDERAALISLAARGIGAAPGHPFEAAPLAPHVRITSGLVPPDQRGLAEIIARAAGATPGLRA